MNSESSQKTVFPPLEGRSARVLEPAHAGLQHWKLSEGETAVREGITNRIFDISLALFGLAFFLPLGILIVLAILLEDGRPVLYTQQRIGRHGKTYRLWKFRSMIKDAEHAMGPVRAAEYDTRVTRVGRMMRNTAMDELPQLFNILKGDMSFVGPRSYREFFVNQFRQEVPHYDLCFLVRPGLTGMAQVYGKKDTTARQKWRFDMLYIRHKSFWLDIQLILLSIWITLRGRWESREKKV